MLSSEEVDARFFKAKGELRVTVTIPERGDRDSKRDVYTRDVLGYVKEHRPDLELGEVTQHASCSNYNPRKFKGTWVIEARKSAEKRGSDLSDYVESIIVPDEEETV